jgi:prepilin-type N-terminal cleavage/methylation domain-containing protein
MKSSSRAAFTLVEIMVVVVIIGLLATLGLPAISRLTQKSGGSTVINNLKTFGNAFEEYAMAMGAWPPDTAEMVVPPGMEDRIKDIPWRTAMPGGHVYDWDLDVNGIKAAISIRPYGGNNADPLFVEIDRVLDNGDTSTGSFRLVGDRFMHILAE